MVDQLQKCRYVVAILAGVGICEYGTDHVTFVFIAQSYLQFLLERLMFNIVFHISKYPFNSYRSAFRTQSNNYDMRK